MTKNVNRDYVISDPGAMGNASFLENDKGSPTKGKADIYMPVVTLFNLLRAYNEYIRLSFYSFRKNPKIQLSPELYKKYIIKKKLYVNFFPKTSPDKYNE